MIERDTRRPSELASSPPFDAILVHGFMLSEGNESGLSLRSILAARAAYLAYDQGRGARHIVLAVGHPWGPDYPSVASRMAKLLEEKYHVPKETIIVRDDASSTYREVEDFLELKREMGWTRLLDISFKKHLWTVPGVFKQFGENVAYSSIEGIIRDRETNPKIRRAMRRLQRSPHEIMYSVYEGGKWIVMHMPSFDYQKLEERNRALNTGKGHPNLIPIIHKPFKFDVYKT